MLPLFGAAAAPPAAEHPTLRRGAQGPNVETVQRRINSLLKLKAKDATWPALVVDGKFGATVEKYVKEFQRTRGMPQTGVVEVTTWTALGYPPGGGVAQAKPAEVPPSEWASIVNRWSTDWHTYRDTAVSSFNKLFGSDPAKAKPQIEAFMRDLAAAKANLDRMKPRVPTAPKTEAERKIVQNFERMTARYNTLASGLYSEAVPVKSEQPNVGFIPLLYALGFAVSAVGAAWAYTSNNYATELREETALYSKDLDARVEASKAGRELPPSSLPGRPSDRPKPSSGPSVGTIIGVTLVLGALGAVGYSLFGGKSREA